MADWLLRRVLAALLAALLIVMLVQPGLAAERTAVFQADLTVPVLGTRSVGVLTVIYDDMSGEGTWSYDGTIDGEPASASGRGTSAVTDGSSFRLTMTSIDSWDMPGFDPDVPRTAVVQSSGALSYVNYDGPVFSLLAIPVAVDPPLSFPIEGIYVITNAGSGDDAVQEIPRTGVGPDSATILTSQPFIGAMTLVALTLLVVTLVLYTSVSGVLGRVRSWKRRSDHRDVD